MGPREHVPPVFPNESKVKCIAEFGDDSVGDVVDVIFSRYSRSARSRLRLKINQLGPHVPCSVRVVSYKVCIARRVSRVPKRLLVSKRHVIGSSRRAYGIREFAYLFQRWGGGRTPVGYWPTAVRQCTRGRHRGLCTPVAQVRIVPVSFTG